MSRPRPIALTGLSPTEQILLEGALFKPSSNQLPGALQVHDLAQAELIIANADDPAVVRELQTRALPAHVLLLGASDAGTGWPVVARPLRLHAVLEAARRALAPPPDPDDEDDTDVPARTTGWRRRFKEEPPNFMATQPFMAVELPAAKSGFESTRQFAPSAPGSLYETTQPFVPAGRDRKDFQATQQFSAREMPSGVPSVVPSDWGAEVNEWEKGQAAAGSRAADKGPRATTPSAPPAASTPAPSMAAAPAAVTPATPTPANSSAPGGRILIIGQPGTAADGLLKILQSAGFVADFASGGEAAFHVMAKKPYHFVFLIEVSLGPEALVLCRSMPERRGASPSSLRVVIVASHRSLVARIRAWFAGCHAWMAIPLGKNELLDYLRKNRPEGDT
jgi:hypothetical protein